MGKASKNDRLSMTTGEGLLNPVAQILCAEETINQGPIGGCSPTSNSVPNRANPSAASSARTDSSSHWGPSGIDRISPLGTTVPPNFWYVESVDGNRAYIRGRKLSSMVTFDVTTVDVVQSGRSNELGTPLRNIMAYDEDLNVNIIEIGGRAFP